MKSNYLYSAMYFEDTEPVVHDIADVLTSVGTIVKVGDNIIKWAHTIADLGAEPESIDCTPLASKVSLSKAGVVQQDNWTIDYYYNKHDYDALETLKAETTSSPITVKYNDGTVFSNSGHVAANYASGHGTNEMFECHAVIELSGAWTKTDPTNG